MEACNLSLYYEHGDEGVLEDVEGRRRTIDMRSESSESGSCDDVRDFAGSASLRQRTLSKCHSADRWSPAVSLVVAFRSFV